LLAFRTLCSDCRRRGLPCPAVRTDCSRLVPSVLGGSSRCFSASLHYAPFVLAFRSLPPGCPRWLALGGQRFDARRAEVGHRTNSDDLTLHDSTPALRISAVRCHLRGAWTPADLPFLFSATCLPGRHRLFRTLRLVAPAAATAAALLPAFHRCIYLHSISYLRNAVSVTGP